MEGGKCRDKMEWEVEGGERWREGNGGMREMEWREEGGGEEVEG